MNREDREKWIENHGMKSGFKFKYVCNFNEEVEALIEHVSKPEFFWDPSISQGRYSRTHRYVNQHQVIAVENSRQYSEPYKTKVVTKDEKLLELSMPILNKLEEIYDGRIAECLLNKLDNYSIIPAHSDTEGYLEHGEFGLGYYYRLIRRIHIPLVTNEKTLFEVDEEQKHLAVGECWETNTDLQHAVWHITSGDRIHFIVDVFPNKWL